jgi:hypothetical protein
LVAEPFEVLILCLRETSKLIVSYSWFFQEFASSPQVKRLAADFGKVLCNVWLKQKLCVGRSSVELK